MKQPHVYVCKYRITKVTLFKHATWQSVAVYTGRRSSQPRPRSSLLSQKHHEAEKISSQYTCQAVVEHTLKLNTSFNQLVHNSRIDLAILSHNKGAYVEDSLDW